jgi:uncharacterized protein (DUF58 family)
MPSGRGLVLFAAGVSMWVAARLIGSGGLEVVGIGIAVLPFLAGAYVRAGRQDIVLKRRLSDVRVSPGTRVTVRFDVENRSTSATSFLMIEDKLPSSLGRPARLVVSGLPRRGFAQVSYTVLPQARGRYLLGPLAVYLSDPFYLARRKIEFDEHEELLVTPEVEDLLGRSGPRYGPSFGASRARQLFRTGEEYYTMRQYNEGDDLRRIHWPAVARTGTLMIRQDESSRRASGVVLIDSRSATLGRSHDAAFERAVSVAATLGVMLAERGFTLKVATSDLPPTMVGQDRFLDTLAGLTHSQERSISTSLGHMRAGASAETTLILVAGPPAPNELPSIIRSGTGYGPKLAVLIYPLDPASLPIERQAQMEGRATQARIALVRSGWDCIVMSPSMKLKERWQTPLERSSALSG